MAPFLGPLYLVAPALVLVGAAVVALAAAAILGLLGRVFGSPGLTAGVIALGTVGALTAVELVLRRVTSRLPVGDVTDLVHLVHGEDASPDTVGTAALNLAQGARLGVSLSEGIVLSADFVEQWLIGLRAVKRGGDPLAPLPEAARRTMEAFLHRCHGGRLMVRASFGGGLNPPSHAGVLPTVGDINPDSPTALANAVALVAESALGGVAVEYRRRVRAQTSPRRAILVLRQPAAEISGVALSRGLDGAPDAVVVDFTRRRGSTQAVRVDVVTREVRAVAPEVPLDAVPGWLHRVTALLVALDAELGSPVLVEFGVERGQVFLVAVRTVSMPSRITWVRAGGPLPTAGARQPRFLREALAGGDALLAAPSRIMGRFGRLAAAEVRDEDGVVYLDVSALRRVLHRVAVGVLFEEPILPLLALIRRRSARVLPDVPDLSQDFQGSWRRFRTWQQRSLAAHAGDRLELGLRRWLVGWVAGLLADGSTGESVPRVHRLLASVMARRLEALGAELAAAEARVEAVEPALRQVAVQVMARGATDFGGLFVGERPYFASLDALERIVANPSSRDAAAQEFDEEQRAFAQRDTRPLPTRVTEPTAPLVMASLANSPCRVTGLVPGVARGRLAFVEGPRDKVVQGAVVVLPDGSSHYAEHVLGAAAVLLLSGGALSPMVQLARELGVPTVLCVDRRGVQALDSAIELTVDGAAGAVTA